MLKWWLLFVMAWSQAAFAAHELSHEPAGAGEVCAVCLHFDRDDEASTDAGCQHGMPAAAPAAPAAFVPFAPVERFTLYRSRASP